MVEVEITRFDSCARMGISHGAFEIFRKFSFSSSFLFFPPIELDVYLVSDCRSFRSFQFEVCLKRGVVEFLDRVECRFLFGNRFDWLNLKFIWSVGMMRFEHTGLRSFEGVKYWILVDNHGKFNWLNSTRNVEWWVWQLFFEWPNFKFIRSVKNSEIWTWLCLLEYEMLVRDPLRDWNEIISDFR